MWSHVNCDFLAAYGKVWPDAVPDDWPCQTLRLP